MNDDVTVFVVDDDPDVRQSLRWMLESDGWRVETVPSGEEFLERFDPGQPACLILDLHMPIMNGLAVQRELARRGCHPPIIFVTAYGEVATSVRAMKQGARDFLEKPVDGDRLLKLVRESADRIKRERTGKLTYEDVKRRLSRLTDNESVVLKWLLRKQPVAVIAHELGLAEESVAAHRAAVLEKLEVDNEVQLLRFMVQQTPDSTAHPSI